MVVNTLLKVLEQLLHKIKDNRRREIRHFKDKKNDTTIRPSHFSLIQHPLIDAILRQKVTQTTTYVVPVQYRTMPYCSVQSI